MKTTNLTFTEIQQEIENWIGDVNFDLKQDWNEDKENMFIQLQCLLVIKSNMDNIEKIGGQIFRSTIPKIKKTRGASR